jgi:antitoxin component YwqK of YwqJK toxin-antitoxin module
MIFLVAVLSAVISNAGEPVLNGVYRTYYENGAVKTISQYRNGRQIGYYKEFHPNGNLAFSQRIKNGKINGPVRAYYENGNLMAEVDFIDNLEQGVLKEYYENGKLKEKVYYIDGVLLRLKKFDNQGKLSFVQEGHFPPGCKVVSDAQFNEF